MVLLINLENNSLKYKIGISLIPGIGCITAKKIIAYIGSVEGVFKEKERTLLKIPGIGKNLSREIVNQNILDKAEQEVEFISKYNINTLFYLDKEYPERLKHCEDAPVMLFIKGKADLKQSKIISIVGTRSATKLGKEICNNLVKDLADRGHNVIIVSGLAYGIDVCAHKAALKNNLKTLAVLGHGLDTIYPSLHKSIARDIANQGALITEFLSKSNPDRENFIKRNRIIAGLSDATIVVESGIKGGALITADIANSYNRDVFAFPGRINDKFSAGCNRLIKINKAALIESVNDIEYILGWDVSAKISAPKQRKIFVELTEEEKIIIDFLKEKGEIDIDLISLETKLPVSKVSSILLNLEFSGLIKSLPGKVYALN